MTFTRPSPIVAAFRRQAPLILFSLWLCISANIAFFEKTGALYPLAKNTGFVVSLAALLFTLTALLLRLVQGRTLYLWTWPLLALVAAVSAFYMDTFGVVIDQTMLVNTLQTNAKEAADVLSIKLLLYIALIAGLPSVLLWMWRGKSGTIKPLTTPWLRRLASRFISAVLAISFWLILTLVIAFISYKTYGSAYSSFIREHKILRFHINPITPLYSGIRLAASYIYQPGAVVAQPLDLAALPRPSQIGETSKTANITKPRLMIMVVGETARADRFSINGYGRETNPLLKKESVLSYQNVASCGTSTAISVPCMFSHLGREDFSLSQSAEYENAIDLLARTGVRVLWRDNNSSSKSVAERPEYAGYEDFKSTEHNPICDAECRDEGMLKGLEVFLNADKNKDTLIVLHQMGSHGPAYYKRYPAQFERFTPTCQSAQLESCNLEAIGNAYDNTILYTDYFLAQVIALLKTQHDYDSAMLYMSDHGESLGEGGVFLHGLPYAFAPKAQTHVPSVLWLSEAHTLGTVEAHKARAQEALSHDALFHTLLGYFGTQTKVYSPKLDMLRFAPAP